MNADEQISLRRLSEMLGINQSQARKYVLKLGYKPPKERTPDSRGKETYVFSSQEAETIVQTRRQQGFVTDETRGTPSSSSEYGEFYIIQVIPELQPERLKLGFAADVQQRLIEHRTAAPTAQVLRTWPCRRTWERTMIDCLAAQGCALVLNEVYECADVPSLLKYADALFEMMPNPNHEVPLSSTSPLNGT